MSPRGPTLNVLRLAFATTSIVAMTYQFAATAETGFQKTNFFSFFTIQSNLLAASVLYLVIAVRPAERGPLFDAVRTGIVLYMAITGVVFALLLSGLQEELQTTIPWVDFVVHKLMPAVLVLDWIVDPPRHRLPLWAAAAWLSFPFGWFVYTLARGSSVDWYPYPFVDVDELGYGGVLARASLLLVGFALAALAVLLLGNRLAGRRAAPAS
ncbi:MAG: Pr6Pr family membrane protein [Actinomycetota bacterium]|nr:Pr6Pr family membrane protein [Actinomycetota bacterium]